MNEQISEVERGNSEQVVNRGATKKTYGDHVRVIQRNTNDANEVKKK